MSELREEAAPGVSMAWFFCLRAGGGRYAFKATHVSEVVRLAPITRLPSAPGFLMGVFTHRGEILPALDLNQLLGKKPIQVLPSTRAAIVRSGPWRLALVAEQVEGLVSLRQGLLEAPPADRAGPAEALAAVVRDAR
ncbi:MAG TPA: chemotaxis protein CheW, partial [Anaeromyxobacteraceae bacterium]|nr:chemotaxis protein CheW [Anaeromyxobacteraceae bacterium]